MARTESTMLELGTHAPGFRLLDFRGHMYELQDYADEPVVIAFICNHCPYVKHIRRELARFGRDYQHQGIGILAINSNDPASHPEDGREGMAHEAAEAGYVFPYLIDETQEVAKAYRAACTPDFYVLDEFHRVVYRGQFDSSRPGNDEPVTGADLRAAVDAVLAGRRLTADQKPSMGCNIKWRPGNEPDYAR